MDFYTDFRRHTAPGPLKIPNEVPASDDNGLGFVNEYRISNRILNSIAMLSFKKNWSEKFNSVLRVGNDIRDKRYSRLTSSGSELDIPTLLSINNAKIRTTSQWEEQYRIVSLFGDLSLSYSNFLFLNITGRNDWSSSLVAPNNKFFYPSASASYVFTEHLKNKWLSFGKLRASFAGVGKDTDPYETNTYYGSYILTSTGQVLWTKGDTRGETALRPEKTTTLEIGTELKFFKNRLGIDFSWYKLNSKELIIPVSLSPTTGFLNSILNAGEIENKGIELVLTGTPVSTNDFNWDVTINYSRNRNKVVNIREGLNEIVVGSQSGYSGSSVTLKYVKGYPVGNLYGTSYQRYYGADIKDDGLSLYKDLPIVIATTGSNAGFPVRDLTQRILGNSQPKWIGGISNAITYKNLRFSMLWETQQGMYKYNQLSNYMAAFGEAKYTENRTETIVFPGVQSNGTPNTQAVWLGQLTGPDGRNYGAGYYRNIYRGVSENFVEDASWIRLRTASLSYSLPSKIFKGNFIKGVTTTLTGNNLLLITDYSGYDPESSSFSAGSNMDGFSGFSYPALRSVIFSINLNF
ncbi:MAG: TonB-dependent receptor [Chitinophagaceae bacterium]|nr:MAG: TonB-dependent receptor [Chitinophagaceae bacterium]